MENLDKMVLDIRKRFKNGETVVLLAECKVHYRGRSRSELGLGGRVIILKNDGATINIGLLDAILLIGNRPAHR